MSFNNPFNQFFGAQKGGVDADEGRVEDKVESGSTFPAGEYQVKVTFVNRHGEQVTKNVDFPLRIHEPVSEEKIMAQATGEVSFMGLHNLGMDVYIGTYPNGHPVAVEILDKDGNIVKKYTQIFNASGHPVE